MRVVIALLQLDVHRAIASDEVIRALRPTYLLQAVSVAFTKNRFVDSDGKAIATASRRLNKSDPGAGASTLFLWSGAVGMATMTMVPSTAFFHEEAWLFESFDAAAILWSATTRIGVAAFGANAQAKNQRQNEAAGK